MVQTQILPKIRTSVTSLKNDGVLAGNSILADINQFARGNPLLSTAVLGTTLTGLTAGIVTVRRKTKKRKSTRKRKKTTRGKAKRRKSKTRRRKRVTHSSPRHKGHKVVKFKTKDGKTVKFKVKKKCHSHKKLRRRRKA